MRPTCRTRLWQKSSVPRLSPVYLPVSYLTLCSLSFNMFCGYWDRINIHVPKLVILSLAHVDSFFYFDYWLETDACYLLHFFFTPNVTKTK